MPNYTRALYLIWFTLLFHRLFFIYCMSVWFLEISHINMNTIIVSNVHDRKKTSSKIFLHNWDFPSSFDRGGLWFAESQYIKLIQQVWWHFGLQNFLSSKIRTCKKEIVILIFLNIVNVLNIFFKVLLLVTLIFNIKKWYQSTNNHLIIYCVHNHG